MPRRVWAVMAIIGFLVPVALSIVFWSVLGVRADLLFTQAVGSPGALFFTADLLLAATCFGAYIVTEQRVRPVRGFWFVMTGLVLVGFSFALPLWLWLRADPRRGPAA